MKRRPKPPVPEATLAVDSAATLQIKVWLTGISPMVWQRVLVPARFTLRELRDVVQVAIGCEGNRAVQHRLKLDLTKRTEVTSSAQLRCQRRRG
jgi:hypothetical protein